MGDRHVRGDVRELRWRLAHAYRERCLLLDEVGAEWDAVAVRAPYESADARHAQRLESLTQCSGTFLAVDRRPHELAADLARRRVEHELQAGCGNARAVAGEVVAERGQQILLHASCGDEGPLGTEGVDDRRHAADQRVVPHQGQQLVVQWGRWRLAETDRVEELRRALHSRRSSNAVRRIRAMMEMGSRMSCAVTEMTVIVSWHLGLGRTLPSRALAHGDAQQRCVGGARKIPHEVRDLRQQCALQSA